MFRFFGGSFCGRLNAENLESFEISVSFMWKTKFQMKKGNKNQKFDKILEKIHWLYDFVKIFNKNCLKCFKFSPRNEQFVWFLMGWKPVQN